MQKFTGSSPKKVLQKVFGYNDFRPLQSEVIESVLAGNDTLAIMPTGGGKSLCYQIPSLIFEGITIVVSPLIALMQDQVSNLQANGVDAVFLNSTLEWKDYLSAANDIKAGRTKIVYVSPEGLAGGKLRDLFSSEGVTVSCITIDEAHCVSEWGHDFRPDYMEIATFKNMFPSAVCLALTATATKNVRDDIVKNLRLKKPNVFVASFNRPNIFLEVQPKKNSLEQIKLFLSMHEGESGIIYCFSRKAVDELTHDLLDAGFFALNYHAGLSDKERADHQEQFIRDKVNIIVATLAFGMGIDKPDVRFVIHADIPKSLEQYYQEIGRAGRDGLPSHALLLYSAGDIRKIRYFFDESADSEKAERLLQSMVSYATARKCRRKILLGYFGENISAGDESSACCDICAAGAPPLIDVTVVSQKIMSCILRLNERFGVNYVVDVLLGSHAKRILENRHNMLSTFGIGREFSKDDWFVLAEELIASGYVKKTGEYNVLCVTRDGRDALQNRDKIELAVRFMGGAASGGNSSSSGASKKKPPVPIVHKKSSQSVPPKNIDASDSESVRIFNELKNWRRKTADENGVPPYVIFGDRTLSDIANKKPRNERELREVYGIGERKADAYGSAILRIVNY